MVKIIVGLAPAAICPKRTLKDLAKCVYCIDTNLGQFHSISSLHLRNIELKSWSEKDPVLQSDWPFYKTAICSISSLWYSLYSVLNCLLKSCLLTESYCRKTHMLQPCWITDLRVLIHKQQLRNITLFSLDFSVTLTPKQHFRSVHFPARCSQSCWSGLYVCLDS